MATQCIKGMTKDTCPYNPRLGCDCGLNRPSLKGQSVEEMKQWIKDNPTYLDGILERQRKIREIEG